MLASTRLSVALLAGALALSACGDPQAAPDPARSGAATTAPVGASSTSTAAGTAAASAAPMGEGPSASAAPSETAVASAAPSASGAKTSTASTAPTTSAAPSAVASATPAPEVTGEAKNEASFSAFLSGSGKYKANQPGTVTAVCNALGAYHINPDYPFKFTLGAAPAGITYGETTVRNVNRSEKKATISVPFTPTQAGTFTISGTYSIAVCTDSNCAPQKVPLSVTVKVE